MLRLEPEGASLWGNRRAAYVCQECGRMGEGEYVQFNERQVGHDQLEIV